MTRIVFWQNMVSHHQSGPIRLLAEKPDVHVTWAVMERMIPERKRMGWPSPDLGKVELVIAPSVKEIDELISKCPEQSVHVLSGVRGFELSRRAYRKVIRTSATMGLLSEPVIPRMRSVVMPAVGYLLRMLEGRRVGFVLGIGSIATKQYIAWGYSRDIVFPYAYILEPGNVLPLSTINDVPRLAFVGQLVRRKGVDILIRALSRLSDVKWTLSIIGDGPVRRDLARMAGDSGIGDRCTFMPFMDNKLALEHVRSADLLVLPSRHDGWGAVVNEAIGVGVPVVCSDRCGAADLLGANWRGDTFHAGSVPELAEVLRRRLELGPVTPDERQRIYDWSQCIGPQPGADYLYEVLVGRRSGKEMPKAPWLKGTLK